METLLITLGTVVLLGLAVLGAVVAFQVVTGSASPLHPSPTDPDTIRRLNDRAERSMRAVRDETVTQLFQAGHEAYVTRKDDDDLDSDGDAAAA